MHIALILCAAPFAQDAWTSFPLPSACHASPLVEGPYELLAANHLPPPQDQPDPPGAARPPVSQSLALQLIDEELRNRDQDARLELAGGRLLVLGNDAANATVTQVLAGLEALDQRLRVGLQVTLQVGEDKRSWNVRPRSGERFALGGRQTIAYIGAQDVNVASDSGVAEPEMHHALLGRTLHLTASRLPSGACLVEGTLDLAELVGLDQFDPDTPDLGFLQLPELAMAQVRFAGLGGARVELAGLPIEGGKATLTIDVAAAQAPKTQGAAPWRALDLVALTHRAPGLAPVDAGWFGVDGPRFPDTVPQDLDPGGIAALLDGGSLNPSPLWSERILFVPRGTDMERTALALLPLLEAGLVEGRIEVTHGQLSASFPVVTGHGARLVVGRERRRATEVDSQLAPSTWMPVIQVERTFDGIVLTGASLGGRFAGTLRQTSSHRLEILSEEVSGLAALERLERGRRGSSVDLAAAAGAHQVLLPPSPDSPAVLARFDRP